MSPSIQCPSHILFSSFDISYQRGHYVWSLEQIKTTGQDGTIKRVKNILHIKKSAFNAN